MFSVRGYEGFDGSDYGVIAHHASDRGKEFGFAVGSQSKQKKQALLLRAARKTVAHHALQE